MRPTTIVTALAIAGFAMGSAIAQQAPKGAQGQPGQKQAFCLQGADGSKNCDYRSMAQCEAAKKNQSPSSTCVRNTQTTGSGSMAPGARPSQPTTGMQPSNPSGPPASSQPQR